LNQKQENNRIMERPRVVVTGLGIICPTGNNVDQAWNAIKNGQSGIGPITRFDPSRLIVRIAGEVKGFDPVALLGAKEARRMDRVSQLALEAARQALESSGYPINDQTREDIGVICGTGIGGFESLLESVRICETRGPDRVNPVMLPNWLPDSPSGHITMRFGIEGPHIGLVGACASGNKAIGEATEMIRRGQLTAALAGGAEAVIVEITFGAFYSMGVLTKDNENPQAACRPFDKTRNGTVIGEGAAMLMLERLDSAVARGATIYAEVVGYGATSDAYHIAAPEPTGKKAARAMTMAMADANIKPHEIQYYNAHGTATELNDLSETKAIKLAFGEAASQLSVNSTKSMTGHLLGGASAIEAVFSVKTITDCFAPPTINLHTPDPELDLDYTPNVGKPREINAAISYAAGLGGHNAAVIFRRFQG
jgi:3-oxoacyl-[acyl-carrier-protein] synthase II